jgi:type III restriction enzyme
VALSEKPNLKSVPKHVREKLFWDEKEKTLTISKPLTLDEEAELKQAVTGEESRRVIEEAAETSRTTAIEFFQTPSEMGERFVVPQIALRVQGELALFDDPEVLDYPWDLSLYDARLTNFDLSTLGAAMKVSEGGEIDVDETSGKVIQRFLPELQRDLGLAYTPEHWDKVQLAKWLCLNLPEQSVTHESKRAFVAGWLQDFLSKPGCDLGRSNLQKFLIRNLIESRIKELRSAAARKAYQQTLFGEGRESRVAVGDSYTFEFHPQAYAPSRDYDRRFGYFDFRKHYYGRIGDFDSKEEYECAIELDKLAQQGRISFWVRNLVRKEGCSFFLQKADSRFYPDFLCRLPSGVILAVEYKGADRWGDAEDDRLIGGLWEELSGGRCGFLMVKNKNWGWIEEKLRSAAMNT